MSKITWLLEEASIDQVIFCTFLIQNTKIKKTKTKSTSFCLYLIVFCWFLSKNLKKSKTVIVIMWVLSTFLASPKIIITWGGFHCICKIKKISNNLKNYTNFVIYFSFIFFSFTILDILPVQNSVSAQIKKTVFVKKKYVLLAIIHKTSPLPMIATVMLP